ncbi:MAG: asparaginase, partial [Cellulomonas sp.]|nr:asparaginase [Cellulomonas sp.]
MDHDPAGTPDAGPVGLVECTRGELVESVHRGSFCIADAGGRALVDAGPVDAPVFPRSTLKPLQLAAMLRSGLELPEELLALGASSHSGAAVHRDGVRRILALHGHDETALRNGMKDPAIQQDIQSTYDLANKLSISGTPSYVVG